MLTPRMAELLSRIGRARRPSYHDLSPQQARMAYRMGAEILDLPRAPLARVENLNAPGPAGAMPARLYAPSFERLPVLRSPIKSEASDCMSKLALASRPATRSIVTSPVSASTMGRLDNVCGAIGASTQAGKDVCSKGPPTDSE